MRDWKKYPLKDLTELITKGTTPTSVGHEFVSRGINFIKIESIAPDGQFIKEKFAAISAECNRALKRSQLRANDILFSIAGALGRTAIVSEDVLPANVNQALAIIRLRRDVEIIPRYLLLALSLDLMIEEVEKLKGGVAQQNLSLEQIGNFSIAIPPLPEQRRIVSILDEAFAAIDKAKANAEKNLQNAKELFESYLQEVFEGKGEEWESRTLGEIGRVSMCKRIFKEQTKAKGDIPFFKIGTFGKDPDAFISNETYNEFRAKYPFPKKGDILISAAGTIGRCVEYDGRPAYFQDSNIVWVDNDEKKVLNKYLYNFYQACKWQTTNGATISRLYNDNLRKTEIVFPKSHNRQEMIVAKLDALRTKVQSLESAYESKIENLHELKKAILKKAFEGGF